MVSVPKPRRVGELPVKGDGMYYVSERSMKVGTGAKGNYKMRHVGEAVPEAFDWHPRIIQASKSCRRLIYVPYACAIEDLRSVIGAIPARSLKGVAEDLKLNAKGTAKSMREAIAAKLRGGIPKEPVMGTPTPVPDPEPDIAMPEPEPVVTVTTGDSGSPRDLLEAMTDDELYKQAATAGLENNAGLERSELINAVLVASGYEGAGE